MARSCLCWPCIIQQSRAHRCTPRRWGTPPCPAHAGGPGATRPRSAWRRPAPRVQRPLLAHVEAAVAAGRACNGMPLHRGAAGRARLQRTAGVVVVSRSIHTPCLVKLAPDRHDSSPLQAPGPRPHVSWDPDVELAWSTAALHHQPARLSWRTTSSNAAMQLHKLPLVGRHCNAPYASPMH